MNLFRLDNDPIIAAQYACDQHVNVICKEATQMLCNYYNSRSLYSPYQYAHFNHPMSIWVRTKEGFYWTFKYAFGLAHEFKYRYRHSHKCYGYLLNLLRIRKENPSAFIFKHNYPFPLCMPDQYKTDNPVESYRAYYIGAKRFATWKRRPKPEWYI